MLKWILTFISMINTTSESLTEFYLYEQIISYSVKQAFRFMVGPGHCPLISKYGPSLSKAVGPVDPSFLVLFVAVFLGCTSTGRVGLCFLWSFVQELPKAQPAVVLVLKRLRRRGDGLVSSDRLGEAGKRTCDPWFTRHRLQA